MYAVYRYAIQTSDMAYDGCPTDKTLPTLVLVCSDLSCPGPVRFPHPIHGCSWCKSIAQHDQHASTFVDLHIAIWQNTYPGEFTMSAHAKEKRHKQSHVFPKWPWMMGEVENPAPDLWLHSETCDFNDFNTAPRGRPFELISRFPDFLRMTSKKSIHVCLVDSFFVTYEPQHVVKETLQISEASIKNVSDLNLGWLACHPPPVGSGVGGDNMSHAWLGYFCIISGSMDALNLQDLVFRNDVEAGNDEAKHCAEVVPGSGFWWSGIHVCLGIREFMKFMWVRNQFVWSRFSQTSPDVLLALLAIAFLGRLGWGSLTGQLPGNHPWLYCPRWRWMVWGWIWKDRKPTLYIYRYLYTYIVLTCTDYKYIQRKNSLKPFPSLVFSRWLHLPAPRASVHGGCPLQRLGGSANGPASPGTPPPHPMVIGSVWCPLYNIHTYILYIYI